MVKFGKTWYPNLGVNKTPFISIYAAVCIFLLYSVIYTLHTLAFLCFAGAFFISTFAFICKTLARVCFSISKIFHICDQLWSIKALGYAILGTLAFTVCYIPKTTHINDGIAAVAMPTLYLGLLLYLMYYLECFSREARLQA